MRDGISADVSVPICRGDKLWIPSGTQAKVDNEYVEDNYARFARTEIFRIVADDKGSVLTPAAFDAALEVHLASIGTVWTDTEQVWNASQTPAAAYGWTDVCLSAQQTRGTTPYCSDWRHICIHGLCPVSA